MLSDGNSAIGYEPPDWMSGKLALMARKLSVPIEARYDDVIEGIGDDRGGEELIDI